MNSARIDTAVIAFRRVLAEASEGEQARVDALVVLAQRTLFAATWPGPHQVARTLTNSHGETALPLFTGMDALEATATRFGWRDPDGNVPFRELTAREALRHALSRGVQFVVIDIGSDHSVEFAREELEPLLQLQTARAGAGPFVATGEPQVAIRDAVRRSSRPARKRSSRPPAESGALPIEHGTGSSAAKLPAAPGDTSRAGRVGRRPVSRPLSQPLTGAAKPPSVKPPPVLSANDNRDPLTGSTPRQRQASTKQPLSQISTEARAATARAEAAARQTPTRDDLRAQKLLFPPKVQLSDALRHGISAALRAFPEVEWACVVSDDSEIPLIGVRVDPSFLNRVTDITDAILDHAEKQGHEMQVLLLNNAELVKAAHKHGQAFYPWQK